MLCSSDGLASPPWALALLKGPGELSYSLKLTSTLDGRLRMVFTGARLSSGLVRTEQTLKNLLKGLIYYC